MVHLLPSDFIGIYRLDGNLDPLTHQDAIREIENSILKDVFNLNFGSNFLFFGAPFITNSFAANMRTTLHCIYAYQDFMVPLVLLKYISSVAPLGRPARGEFESVFFAKAFSINTFLRYLSFSEPLHQSLIVDTSGVGLHAVDRISMDFSLVYPFPVPEGTVFADGLGNTYTVNAVVYTPTRLEYVFLPAPNPGDTLINQTYRRILRKTQLNIL